MCNNNPDAVPIPDDWEPEQAEAVITFLEAIIEGLQARYGMAIRELWLDRRVGTPAASGVRDPAEDGDMPF